MGRWNKGDVWGMKGRKEKVCWEEGGKEGRDEEGNEARERLGGGGKEGRGMEEGGRERKNE